MKRESRLKTSQKKVQKRKKSTFDETKVGHLLKYEAPLEYGILMEVSRGRKPNADLIEQIGYASLNLLFRKPKFRRSLIEYRKSGLYPPNPQKSSYETELFYKKIRKSNAIKVRCGTLA